MAWTESSHGTESSRGTGCQSDAQRGQPNAYLPLIDCPLNLVLSVNRLKPNTTRPLNSENILKAGGRWLLQLLTLSALFTLGCDTPNSKTSQKQSAQGTDAQAKAVNETAQVDHLAMAREKLERGLWDAAAKSAAQSLLQSPENDEAALIAAKAEYGRENDELAIQFASDIKPESRLIDEAINLQVEAMYRLKKFSQAAEVLEAAIERVPTNWLWRHRVWQLFNRIGRREQASLQAEMLCRAGQATEQELNSLMRRTDAYPTVLADRESTKQWFEPGLGLARWLFTQGEYRSAISELSRNKTGKTLSPAGEALHGRLLAETQAIAEFPIWHAEIDQTELAPLGDYWAGLGIYFFDLRNFETSARCLLEAIRRNPTDRRTMQRLAKVFDALGQSEQAEQYRRRGVAMAQTEATADSLQMLSVSDNRQRLAIRQQLMRQTLELERPFESLAWASLVFPSSSIAQQQSIAQQRNTLLESADARSMSRQAALIGVNVEQFKLGPAYESLVQSKAVNQRSDSPREITPLGIPSLSNVASKAGLEFQWYQDREINLASIPIHESIGGGIAVIDYDQDGWPDLYFAQGSGEPPTSSCTRSNLLMRNLSSRFIDTTASADSEDFNYGSGLAAGDVNQDGWIDLYVGSLGQNRLLINNGDGTFSDATETLGRCSEQFSTSLGIADLDGDGLPELFESVYIEMEGAFALPEIGNDGKEVQPSPLEFYAESDRWFSNLGDGRFQENVISREDARPGTSLGLIITNFDQQPGNEIFVGNDVRPNHFLRHQKTEAPPTGNGATSAKLLNSADALGVANGFSGAANGCMGIAAGDYNRDGRIDLHITNFNGESANLYLQNDATGFTDFAIRYQLDTVSKPYVGFGTKAIDFDSDGWLDLIVTNGHIFDMSQYGEGFTMPPQLLMNRGTRFELAQVSDESDYWAGEYLGRSMAKLDYNRDGKSDVVINHLDQPAALLENQTENAGFQLTLELIGTTSERDAIGAQVTVVASDLNTSAWVTAGDGYLCSDEPALEFGLGGTEVIKQLLIKWPSGLEQIINDVPAGRYLLVEGQSQLHHR